MFTLNSIITKLVFPLLIICINIYLLWFILIKSFLTNYSVKEMNDFVSLDRNTKPVNNLKVDDANKRELVRSDCDTVNVLCASTSNCKVLCRPTLTSDSYKCENYRCIAENSSINEETGQINQVPGIECNRKIGEIAVLKGYTDLGTAEWICVNLYSAWNPNVINKQTGKTMYCEDGIIDFDAGKKAPDARSACTCKYGYYKIVPKTSQYNEMELSAWSMAASSKNESIANSIIHYPSFFSNNVNNFKVPHCVRWPRLYSSHYELME